MQVGREIIRREIIWVDYDIKDDSLCDSMCQHGQKSTGCDLFEMDRVRKGVSFERVSPCRLHYNCCPACSVRILLKKYSHNSRITKEEKGDDVIFRVNDEFMLQVHKSAVDDDSPGKCVCQPWLQFPDNTPIGKIRNVIG